MNMMGLVGLLGLLAMPPMSATPQKHSDTKPTLTAKEQVEITVFKHLIGQIKAKAIREKATILMAFGFTSDPPQKVIKACQGMGITVQPYSKRKMCRLNNQTVFWVYLSNLSIKRSQAQVKGGYTCGPKYGTSSDFTLVFGSGIWKVTKAHVFEQT